jgi:enterochelin esterase-like enzyme
MEYRTRYRGESVAKYAYMYLPAGYDANDSTRYDVLYLMHGGGQTPELYFDGAGRSSTLKTMLDHMIEGGRVAPTIVVAPSFYPNGDARFDVSYVVDLARAFPRELRADLMPAVERRYRTYARTPDARGFEASREHRAFGGFSMGAVNTRYAFIRSLDRFKYFMPMAGDSWVLGVTSGGSEETASYLDRVVRESGYGRDDYLIAASVGSRDSIGGQIRPQVREMWKFPSFNRRNLRFTLDPGGEHSSASWQNQLYNSLPLLFEDATR